jgi:hypothetical protein
MSGLASICLRVSPTPTERSRQLKLSRTPGRNNTFRQIEKLDAVTVAA